MAEHASAQWQPSQRYPDPLVRIVDPSFARYRLNAAKVERLATGFRWCEGPVWFGDGRYLLWSDIPNNRIMRWDEETGAASVFRRPSNFANGNTRDRQGRLLTCEHGARRVTRTEYDGTITVIADRFEGKPLNSPNDIVCKSDGSIWFTDPPFGILGYYEGYAATPELPTNVYRVDGAQLDGSPSRPATSTGPTGSRSRRTSRSSTSSCPATCRAGSTSTTWSTGARASPTGAGSSMLARGRPTDSAGRRRQPLVRLGHGPGRASTASSIYNPDGPLIGRIDLPERCANLCFGGPHRNRLFMAASTSLYSLYVNTQGVAGG